VEVKIGVLHAAREITIESGQTAKDVADAVSTALSKDERSFTLTDEHGRQVIVPTDKLAYVEIGEPESRRVGFGAL
jgi:hypothetical protein